MRKTATLIAAAAASLLLIGAGCSSSTSVTGSTQTPSSETQAGLEITPISDSVKVGADVTANVMADVKVFSMDSFYEIVDGKPAQKFSLKEISVKKGDKVRVLVNNTKGMHDFNIDELDVHVKTPTGQVTAVEFTASKSGEFVYYCSTPNHRANGQWGTLKVTE